MWKTAVITCMTVLLSVLLTGAGYAYYLYDLTSDSLSKMNTEYEAANNESVPEARSSLRGPLRFLVVGVAGRPGEPALSDVIMGVSVNPNHESTLIFNIPRDTKTAIPGRARPEKINHAYSYGGASLVKETAERELGQSFDFVVEVDMEGFTRLVDLVGGIEVENPFAFSQNDITNDHTYHYDEGPVQLDGERALHYVRMRKQDPRGDLGRNARQREVFEALLRKSLTIDSLIKSREILDHFSKYIKTNLTFADARALLHHYRPAADYVNTFELTGTNKVEDGVSYYIISDKEWKKASLRLERHASRR
ncbi:LCP family protein [Bacillus piscicola]|uniref:LCP family protein n=1 Tax=Bacillus piscicola TaxID=1632684 RepID=UPI001F097F72|nr:LCP family protein [Bacillus piscicola]